MVLTNHFPDDFRAFGVGVGFGQPEHVHRVQDAPVHRLQPVAHIRNRAANVYAQGILQICSMHNIFNIYRKIS